MIEDLFKQVFHQKSVFAKIVRLYLELYSIFEIFHVVQA